MSAAALLIAAALAVPGQSPAAERDFSQPPAGLPADQKLWAELQDGTSRAMVGFGKLSQCAYRTQYGKYYEDLDAARGKDASAERSVEATRLRDRLETAARNGVAVRPPEGISIRRCRGVLLEFANRMPELADPAIAKEMPSWREQSRSCATDMQALAARAVAAAGEYEAALDAIDRFLGRVAPTSPPGPVPAAGGAK
jgi:hypothetical protein